MTVFCVTYRYTDLELRARHREQHLTRLTELAKSGRLIAAGPRPDSSGAVIVIFGTSAEEVEELMRSDVYSLNGVLADLSITAFVPAVMAPCLTWREPAEPC